jgi:hypothetical protein
VIVELDLESSSLRFEDIPVGDEAVKTVPFIAKDPAGVRFGQVTVAEEGVSAKMVKSPQGAGWSLEVRIRPRTIGHVAAKIEVEILEPETKKVTLFCTANATGDIRAMPEVLTITRKPGDPQATGTVRIQADKGPLKIKSVKEEGGFLEIALEEAEKGKATLLHATLTSKGQAELRFSTTIVVNTSSDKQPVLEIPVRVRNLPN